ncbi:MAG: orotidine-5'-phosphate decarboxylase [Meiothermus sp.]|nr:orotidine-5'-phosphate decarboxylase [Meiothermus sp.]
MPEFVEAVLARPPLVLGLDPRPELHGKQPLKHIRRYSLELMEALGPRIAAVKPQAAFFEALGAAGFALMHELITAARVLSIPVIIDAKRGDIGSTAEAYAKAYLDAYPGSALTVNPYLGSDALEPFFRAAERSGGAVFVLVKTSNPGSGLLQDLEVRLEGRGPGFRFHHAVADYLAAQARLYAVGEWSRVGAVVGATYPEQVAEARRAMPNSLLLLPGLGAQGGEPLRGAGLLNSASRSLYYPKGRTDVGLALEQAEAYLRELGVENST